MSKKSTFSKNEVRSGFLVFICIGTLLGLLFMSGSSQLFKETYSIDLLFNYISGLKENAPVHLAGHAVGKVTEIRFTKDENPKVRVTLEINENAIVREDSEAFINIMGFMGETYIELSVGSTASERLREGDTIDGVDPVVMMELVKRGTEIMEEFEKSAVSMQKTMVVADEMVNNLNVLLKDNNEEINSIFGNLDVSSENLRDMTSDLKSHPWKLLRKPED